MHTRVHVVSFVAATVCLLLGSVAVAHDFPVERSLLAQVSRDRVEMMLVYQEPPGPRTDLLLAQFDLDNDGDLAGPELALAEGELTKRAFDGVRLEFIGERAGMHEPDMRVKRSRDGGLAVAFYLKYELEPQIGERVFAVRLNGSAERIVPLTLIVEAGEGMTLDKSASPVAGHTTKPVELRAPVEHLSRFVVERAEDPAMK